MESRNKEQLQQVRSLAESYVGHVEARMQAYQKELEDLKAKVADDEEELNEDGRLLAELASVLEEATRRLSGE